MCGLDIYPAIDPRWLRSSRNPRGQPCTYYAAPARLPRRQLRCPCPTIMGLDPRDLAPTRSRLSSPLTNPQTKCQSGRVESRPKSDKRQFLTATAYQGDQVRRPGVLDGHRRRAEGRCTSGIHPREIRDRLFVDGRRPSLSRLPDFRQVATGHDRQEARCHLPIKALPAAAGKSSYSRGPRASMQEARGRFDASRCGN
jgi:hypothetical protein